MTSPRDDKTSLAELLAPPTSAPLALVDASPAARGQAASARTGLAANLERAREIVNRMQEASVFFEACEGALARVMAGDRALPLSERHQEVIADLLEQANGADLVSVLAAVDDVMQDFGDLLNERLIRQRSARLRSV